MTSSDTKSFASVAANASNAKATTGSGQMGDTGFKTRQRPDAIRNSNIVAAKAVADAVRTSLGPRGMDKMIQTGNGEVTITNDGATILKQMSVIHPAAKMLVELSRAQDIEAGDGTTTVVVIAGSLLDAASRLVSKGIHPTAIAESFEKAAEKATEILKSISIPTDLSDKDALYRSAATALNSKVVSQHTHLLAPMAVQAVLRVIDPKVDTNVDLHDIRIVKKLGGTIEDTELVDGLVLDQKTIGFGAPTRIEKAKIALIQFCISPPKTDMENMVIISDHAQMDRVIKEERQYILNIIKQIKKTNCNVLLIQKSILRDAISDLAIHYLAKMKILIVKDVEREDVPFIAKTLGCKPIASLDHFQQDMLGTAELVEEITAGSDKIVKITGVAHPGHTVSILLRGSNKLVLEEADRSIHDALCVIRCLVKERALIAGGAAPEIELSVRLAEYAQSLSGVDQYCIRAFAEALEVIPYTLAENAGLNPIATVTELRNRHAQNDVNAGINVRKGLISNILEENVVQPLLVSVSAIRLATETVRSILKIDDIIETM
jgi:T-complex protein 1 subunit delta